MLDDTGNVYLSNPLGILDSISLRGSHYEVETAYCSLKVQNDPQSETIWLYVKMLTRDWEEGLLSGATGNCCYDSAANNVAWTSPGGDYNALIIDSFEVAQGDDIWKTFNIKPYVDSLIAGAAYYGLVLVGAGDVNKQAIYFYSDDATIPANRPIYFIGMIPTASDETIQTISYRQAWGRGAWGR